MSLKIHRLEDTRHCEDAPCSGVCAQCNQPWDLTRDGLVLYETFILRNVPLHAGQTVSSAVAAVSAHFLNGRHSVLKFMVTNLAEVCLVKDPVLADLDIHITLNPQGVREVTAESQVEDGDHLTIQLIAFYHLGCKDTITYFESSGPESQEWRYLLRRDPSTELIQIVAEKHARPYLEAGGHFDSYYIIEFDLESQPQLEALFSTAINTKSFTLSGHAKVHTFLDYQLVGEPWESGDPACLGHKVENIEADIICHLQFTWGKLASVDWEKA